MLAVTGIGMVSSLGLDATSSCAAARAGLQRLVESDDAYPTDEDGDELAPLAGHRVPLLTRGFFGFGRLVQLGSAALSDLQRTNPGLEGGRTGVILVAGAPVYQEAWLARERNESGVQDRDELEGDQAQFEAFEKRTTADLLPAIVEQAGLLASPDHMVTIRATCVGIVPALRTAAEWLRSGACDRCVVGAVDSLVDANVLEPLVRLGLTRTAGSAVGMQPGEAGCFLALELSESVGRASRSLATLYPPAWGSGAAHPRVSVASPPETKSIDQAIAEAIADSYGGRFTGIVLPNLNGDEHRAMTWGHALARLRATHDLGALPTWLPCASFGDVGAVFGFASIAMVIRSWVRRYAPLPDAMVCLLDDVGGRGVVPIRSAST